MKPNRLNERLANEELAVGHMILEFGTRGIAQMLDVTGVDFTVVDMEHTGFTSANIADMMAWFQATDLAPIVRVPRPEYHFIARTMDAGALGIMVPNVKTPEEAHTVVNAAKYAPLGDRGVALGIAHTEFERVDPEEFMGYANENTTVICQIESEEGLDNIDAIAQIPGVDVLWVGHFDLTQSQGIPGQFHHQKFLDALDLVVDTANAHGLGAGIQPGSLEQAQEWIEKGFNVISYSGDLFLFVDTLSQAVEDVRGLAPRE